MSGENISRAAGRKGIDAQRAGWRLLLGSYRLHCLVDRCQCRANPLHESSAGIGQGYAARRPIEQPDAQLSFQLADGVAQRSRRHAELQRRGPEGALSYDGQHRFELDQSLSMHCPDNRNITCPFILVIIGCVHPYVGRRRRRERTLPSIDNQGDKECPSHCRGR